MNLDFFLKKKQRFRLRINLNNFFKNNSISNQENANQKIEENNCWRNLKPLSWTGRGEKFRIWECTRIDQMSKCQIKETQNRNLKIEPNARMPNQKIWKNCWRNFKLSNCTDRGEKIRIWECTRTDQMSKCQIKETQNRKSNQIFKCQAKNNFKFEKIAGEIWNFWTGQDADKLRM